MYEDPEEIKTFTLSEARSLLPRLRKLLSHMTREREALVGLRVEIDKARAKSDYGGGSLAGPAYLLRLAGFSEVVQEIETLGVVIKDFRTGLIDFPYERDGRIVYLCWKLNETEIEWWHETDSGFAGRRPLFEENE